MWREWGQVRDYTMTTSLYRCGAGIIKPMGGFLRHFFVVVFSKARQHERLLFSSLLGHTTTMTTTAGEEVRQGQLPLVPREVLIQLVLPHAFDSFEQALELMLLCRAAHDYATTAREFWEPFLWRRLHETVIPYLKSAYHRHAQPLVKLLQQYVCVVLRVACCVLCVVVHMCGMLTRVQHTHTHTYAESM
jgi:hypothetical protein